MTHASPVQLDRWEALPAPVQRLADLGLAPGDDDVTQLRKRVLNLATAFIALVAPVWVITYAALGLWLSAAIPFAYILATAVLLRIRASGRPSFETFRRIELAMILLLPFLLQWSVGGFAESSLVALWALVGPLGAVFFTGVRSGLAWFVAFVALTVVSAAIEPLLDSPDPPIPDAIGVGFFVLNVIGVSATVFGLIEYFVRAREREHERSEALLLNVLPAPVARRLKESPGVIAEAHDEVTVLFADLVDFTPMAERMPAEAVVALLDEVFTRWDALARVHGLEKIKTIGDAYMAVAGLPEDRSDHAEVAARMALEMPGELAACERADAHSLRVRIGLDSGPVVAGVIGRSKFIYDLWGDTVNTASRMESTGVPGRVQLTARTRAKLAGRFGLEPRGEIEVKGKGRLDAYLLSADAPGSRSATIAAATPERE